jgi:hypothetical protein
MLVLFSRSEQEAKATVGNRSVVGTDTEIEELASLLTGDVLQGNPSPIEAGERLLARLGRDRARRAGADLFPQSLQLQQAEQPILSTGVRGQMVDGSELLNAGLRKAKKVSESEDDSTGSIPVCSSSTP